MSDSFSGKNGKVRVMYVRSDDGDEKNNKNKRPTDNRRNDSGSRDKNPRSSRDNGPRGASQDKGREKWPSEKSSDRERPARRDDNTGYDSPWKTVSRAPDETPDHGGIGGKSQIDHEQIRRQRAEETRVYGENACQALFKSRPEAIIRAWFLQEVTPRFRDALRWMAANRKAYHVVEEDELTKASGTEHHGGVCFLIKKRNGMDVSEYLHSVSETDCVLALEDVGNPHNLGGIIRSCAHFGVNGVLVQDAAQLESGAAVRTAEGGAEHVKAINADDFIDVLSQFRQAGYTIVTTSSHKGTALSQTTLPAKMVIVLGQEGDGLSDSAWQQGDMKVSIDGTGKVESLNISVATGILLAEWWRQNHH
ncbi:tRNA/rRNA methyltransferase [Pectobacteriaceae bacterium CE70]|uniref:tRNA/rRNA methyltransferase n=1 Tax=Serratia sp. (strain ATCC 39006) TaxID=104623 RepID=A0A2I5T559_SERS3|nr:MULTISPECIES: tRNA/rRNA methyltransferase [Enterobacterales]WJV61762.1 tRNA/rRNA methyltransferase [Pectobacteriaceae bacterium C52]WJV66026.1 tRNA/rRNA methyltransferase [Pectobacteriaceae bacterium CE70]WJY10043.1 tRNA/rRNA methyltransferase [Pectobacteriaceae bacterium C80]AUG99671.1 tRNA/rRNA methyltransferase [Serratia sp. ATCC 39006]AUH03989.1 tRNA/rRNA methyltransferase [Serratia sp. ATCC 39006]